MKNTKGFVLVELMLAMAAIVTLTATTWYFIQPATDQVRVDAFVADLIKLSRGIKQQFGGGTTAPYILANTPTLYMRDMVPNNLANPSSFFWMDSPWGTRVQVRSWPLVSSTGTPLDPDLGSAFNIRIEMPSGINQRKDMCAPLVAGVFSAFPQVSYTDVGQIGARVPGTVLKSSDMGAGPTAPLSAQMPAVIQTLCGQAAPFVLVVADG